MTGWSCMRNVVQLACGLFCVALSNLATAEPPELVRIFPAGATAGTVVDVTLKGKFPDWPVEIACESTSVRWEVLTENGKLRATIAQDAKSERCWVRLVHAKGASIAKAFMIECQQEPGLSFPEILEVETTEGKLHAQKLDRYPCIVNGVLDKKKDVDTFTLDLKQGTPLVAWVEANKRLRSPVDMTLQVLDEGGFVHSQNLDCFGLDPGLVFNPSKDGRYAIRLFGFPSTPDSTVEFGGKENWVYRLNLSDRDDVLRPSWLKTPADKDSVTIIDSDAVQPVPIVIPSRYASVLARPKVRHTFTFTAKSGTQWRFGIEGRALGSMIDPVIAIENQKGKELTRQDDSLDDRDPQLDWKSPADGNYRLIVRDLNNQGGDRFFYQLTITPMQPDFSPTVTTDLVRGVINQELEIPVMIQRILGFEDKITVRMEGLPPKITCTEVISEAKGDTAKKVTLRLNTDRAFQGPIKIVANPPSLASHSHSATAPEEIPLWLSITEAK